MREYHEVMNTIKEFTAEDAMVIVGTVIDESMEDRLRVTMVATGLGGGTAKLRAPNIQLVDQPVMRTGTDNAAVAGAHINYEDFDQPAVVRRGRGSAPGNASAPAFDAAEIPAFLRKQAD
jgi:cell division protein FtsZ